MINEDIKLLDVVVNIINQQVIKQGYGKFEFYFILSLNIVKYELFTTRNISDSTADAITQLFSFQVHEFYYRDYPDIYKQCLGLFSRFKKYNEKLQSHDLPGKIGVKDKDWIRYFNRTITHLIESNKPNNK